MRTVSAQGGSRVTKPHWCHSCKGAGKILTSQTRILHGVKKTYDVLVDCPGLLVDQFETRNMPISGQDRAAGEGKEQDDAQA